VSGYRPSGPLDPVAEAIAAFFAADPGWQALTTTPVAETRAAIRAATPVTGEPAMAHVEDFTIPVAGGEIGVRLYRPDSNPPAVVVWAHGGGFALGSIDEIDNFSRALAAESGCAVVSVEYRLAPEHRFPTALEDVLAAVRWVAAHRIDLAGGDLPLVLGGDSAGANLATVAARRLHKAGELVVTANVLAYPCTDGPEAESLRRFESPFLGLKEVSFFVAQYLPEAETGSDPDFAPLHAPDLGVLPPTLVITAEHDILTEQAEAYGDALRAAGVAAWTSRYPGMIHGFLTMDAFFPGAAGAAIREISAFIADTVRERGTVR
jgi:acetyl esterase